MTFKELKRKIKQEQKDLALKIRRGKFLRKPKNRKDVTKEEKKLFFYGSTFQPWEVEALSRKYRHNHIIYCNMFNKTPYDKIEVPRDDNSPNSSLLENIREEWEKQLDETICHSS